MRPSTATRSASSTKGARRRSCGGVAATCAELLPCRELMALYLTEDPPALAQQIERMRRHAAIFGPRVITVLVNAEPLPWVAAWLASAAAELRAEVPAVRFGLEVSPLFPLATIADGRRLCTEIDDPGFGLIVDSWHFFHGDSTWEELRSLAADEVAIVHFSDHGELGPDGFEVERNRRELPGLGVFDLDRFVAEMRCIGYAGGVTVEVVSERLRGLTASEYAEAAYAASAPFWRHSS